MPCAEWYTSVDSRQVSTVELKSKAFLAVDSRAWYVRTLLMVRATRGASHLDAQLVPGEADLGVTAGA
eukprot:236840-Prorocentrum_minimum.AAC.1